MFNKKQRGFSAERELTVKFTGLFHSLNVLIGVVCIVPYRKIMIICAVLLFVLGESVHFCFLFDFCLVFIFVDIFLIYIYLLSEVFYIYVLYHSRGYVLFWT